VKPQSSSHHKKKILFLDFDGVICDSIQVIIDSVNEYRVSKGRAKLTQQEIDEYFKIGVREAMIKEGFNWFSGWMVFLKLRNNVAKKLEEAQLYPGAKQALIEVSQKADLIIVTANKPQTVRSYLAKRGVHVRAIYGSIPLGKKKTLRKLCRKYHQDPANTWYVGDQITDGIAAHEAGMKFAGARWGYQTVDALKTTKPERILRNILQINELV
jgi:phosphoglycolate phosphatase